MWSAEILLINDENVTLPFITSNIFNLLIFLIGYSVVYKKPLICHLFYSFLYGVLDQLSVVQLSNPVPLDSPISPSVPVPTGRFSPRRSKQTPCSFIHIKYICKIRGFACSKCPRIVLFLRKKPHYFDLKKKFDEIFF